jgi:hypothetical protein
VVGVEPGTVVVVEVARVVVVDRPEPPEDGRDVLGVLTGAVVEVDGDGEGSDGEVEVVVPEPSPAGAVEVVVGEEALGRVVVVVSAEGSEDGTVAAVVDVVALPSPGSESARSARAGPADRATAATSTVARVIARRTRLSCTQVSRVGWERQRCRRHRA